LVAAADISEADILVAAAASTVVVEVIREVVDLIRGRFIPVRAFIRGRFIPVPAFILDHFNNDWLSDALQSPSSCWCEPGGRRRLPPSSAATVGRNGQFPKK
jgi:hypothetical protein